MSWGAVQSRRQAKRSRRSGYESVQDQRGFPARGPRRRPSRRVSRWSGMSPTTENSGVPTRHIGRGTGPPREASPGVIATLRPTRAPAPNPAARNVSRPCPTNARDPAREPPPTPRFGKAATHAGVGHYELPRAGGAPASSAEGRAIDKIDWLVPNSLLKEPPTAGSGRGGRLSDPPTTGIGWPGSMGPWGQAPSDPPLRQDEHDVRDQSLQRFTLPRW
jgi:hypothetical protein